jgi:hypothetical protein
MDRKSMNHFNPLPFSMPQSLRLYAYFSAYHLLLIGCTQNIRLVDGRSVDATMISPLPMSELHGPSDMICLGEVAEVLSPSIHDAMVVTLWNETKVDQAAFFDLTHPNHDRSRAMAKRHLAVRYMLDCGVRADIAVKTGLSGVQRQN